MPFLYVGNLGLDYDQDAIEKDFNHFGSIRESWHWPTFGYCFFEYDSHRDAEDALKEMNGSKSADGKSMSVQWARRPRKHLPSRATTNDKCYVCNRYGHFARDCPDIGTAPSGSGSGSNRSRNRRSPYRSRDYSPRRRSRSPPRRRSRSRSPYNSRRSPDRRSNDRKSPDRRSPDRRSPDRRSPDRRSPDRRSPDRRSPDRRSRSPYSRKERTERSFSRSPVRRSRS